MQEPMLELMQAPIQEPEQELMHKLIQEPKPMQLWLADQGSLSGCQTRDCSRLRRAIICRMQTYESRAAVTSFSRDVICRC